MWRVLVMVAVVTGLGEAQRSSYAPRPGSASRLLPRYRKTEQDTGLGARAGEEESSPEASSSEAPLVPELEGTLEDKRFVQRVSQWPEERQPFWFKNRHAISSLRGREIDGGNRASGNAVPSQFQSSFRGSGDFQPRPSSAGRGRRPSDEFRDPDNRQTFSAPAFFHDLQSEQFRSASDVDPHALYFRLRSNV